MAQSPEQNTIRPEQKNTKDNLKIRIKKDVPDKGAGGSDSILNIAHDV
jgi:hypothetical protein